MSQVKELTQQRMLCTIQSMMTPLFFRRISFIFLFVLFSCSQNTAILEEETLFTLDYGRLEDEVDLNLQDTDIMKNHISFSRGFVYVANGISNKIMRFNAYGDILSMVYNPLENPPPLVLASVRTSTVNVNRRATEYPFRTLNNFAITSQGYYLVQDEVQSNRVEFDEEYGAALKNIVLRFDENERILDFIGQEGLGGTAFPFIHDIEVNGKDEMIVICEVPGMYIIYWFTPDAEPIFLFELPIGAIPVLDTADTYSIESVTPSKDRYSVFVHVNHVSSGETDSLFTDKRIRSVIHEFSLLEKEFVSAVEIPLYHQGTLSGTAGQQQLLYELLGLSEGGHFFLLASIDARQKDLLILGEDGTVLTRQSLLLNDLEIFYRRFHVSLEGILSGLLAFREHAEVRWWRTDKFLRR